MALTITESVIEEVKARTDIVELISSYGVQIRSAGSSKKACCPFHNEKTPSFNINEAKGYYHCFGCGESGDAIKFVQKMEGLSFAEAVARLAEKCGVTIVEKEDKTAVKRKRLYALMAELAAFYSRCLKSTKEAQIARDYLLSRDLPESVQDDFLIGYAPNGFAPIAKWAEKHDFTLSELEEAGVVIAPKNADDRGYHRFSGRLMFSIKDKQGRVVAFSGRQLVENKKSGKYVNSPETPIFKKSNVLFGFDKAAANIAKSSRHEVIVCEGQIDTIRLHISGFAVAVASQGTAFTEEHVKMLKRVADQVTLVFDDDAAGHKATIRTAGLFLEEGMPVKVVSLPGGDDPDSFLRSHSKEEFQSLLDSAESIMSFQVRSERLKESAPDSVEAISRVAKAVLSTVAHSKSAVMKASMISEASRLMKVPEEALKEDFGENFASIHVPVSKPAPTMIPRVSVQEPPKVEMELMEFLMANEYDTTIATALDALVVNRILTNDFTVKFLEVWSKECSSGVDGFADFAGALNENDKRFFAKILNAGGRSLASKESASHQLREFISALWQNYFKTKRAELAAGEEIAKRFEYTGFIKLLESGRWPVIKEAIQDWKKGLS